MLWIVFSFWFLTGKLVFPAEHVTLNVVALNSTDERKEGMPVVQYLPPEVKKEDVIDTGGMKLVYDEEKSIYSLRSKVNLNPKESVTFKVVLRDVWQIPQGQSQFLLQQTENQLKALEGTKDYQGGKQLRDSIASKIDEIKTLQESEKTSISKRIESYRVSMQRLDDIRSQVTLLDNFVNAVQKLTGVSDESKLVKFTITVKNPSQTEPAQGLEINQYLPKGVKADQVIDSRGLDIKYDVQKEMFYLYKKIDMKPGETKTYEITLLNVWYIPEPQLNSLEEKAQDLATQLAGTQYKAVGAYLMTEVRSLMSTIRETQENAKTPRDKIATYDANIQRMATIKENIEQLRKMIDEAEKSKAKSLTENIKSVTPDVAATWKLIYATIAFLTLISLFFYFLWWGQTKAKQGKKLDVIDSKR